MEYRYSVEIDPNVYEAHGLDYGITLRVHQDQDKEVRGALRAQTDWTKYVSSVTGYNGGLGNSYTFICATVPECIPERLEIISYANEYAFLYDDKMEDLDLVNNSGAGLDMLETFGANALSSKVSPGTRPEKLLQAKILQEMMAIDAPRAITSMKAWSSFVQSAAATRSLPFTTLAEYLPARAIDAGELIWFGTLTFGMALTIPDREYDFCMEMARPGYIALGLVNDLYSWDKEQDAAKKAGLNYVFNAIWVIMNEMSVNEEEAKKICCEEISQALNKFKQNVSRVKMDTTLSTSLQTYLEAVLLSYIGNLVWSITCPRYHSF